MIREKIVITSTLAAAVVALAGCASSGSSPALQTLADQTFKASFQPGPGQDLSRLEQDQTQIDCAVSRATASDALAETIKAREIKTIVYPAGGKLMVKASKSSNTPTKKSTMPRRLTPARPCRASDTIRFCRLSRSPTW